MPSRLHFTDSDEANKLIASDPMALLVGFVLDQQVTIGKAFSGPLAIEQRVGSLDAAVLAEADLDAVFREKPAIHRFPGNMAKRVHALAEHVRDEYGGDAAQVWKGARDADALRANLEALPGFGEMKVGSLAAVLANRFGVKKAAPLAPDHMTLGDVDSADALAEYQAQKRERKAQLRKQAADG
ncbi:MAG TPA: HhH-GPD-type base excision DNA repair protein [Solirubrobacteraceae bacterium]